jgi:hypothetical protein
MNFPRPNSQAPVAQRPATSGKENQKLFYFALGGAALVLALVLGFNFAGPPGPGQRTDIVGSQGAPKDAVSPAATPGLTAPLGAASGAQGRGGSAEAPRADTPNSPGRENIGAPKAGGSP